MATEPNPKKETTYECEKCGFKGPVFVTIGNTVPKQPLMFFGVLGGLIAAAANTERVCPKCGSIKLHKVKEAATPTEVKITILKKPLYQLLITSIETHPKRYLVFASLLLLLFIFYWFQLRPAQIRQSCGDSSDGSGLYTRCLHQKGIDR